MTATFIPMAELSKYSALEKWAMFKEQQPKDEQWAFELRYLLETRKHDRV